MTTQKLSFNTPFLFFLQKKIEISKIYIEYNKLKPLNRFFNLNHFLKKTIKKSSIFEQYLFYKMIKKSFIRSFFNLYKFFKKQKKLYLISNIKKIIKFFYIFSKKKNFYLLFIKIVNLFLLKENYIFKIFFIFLLY